eukprot:Partr_v1_DN26687_c3_g1_i2_m69496 putative Vacuolar Protein
MSQNILHFADIAQNSSQSNYSLIQQQSGGSGPAGGNRLEAAGGDQQLQVKPSIDSNIFSISKVQFEFKGSLVAMAVCNNILLMAMSHLRLLRIDLLRPQVIEDIEISKKSEDIVEDLFLDPTGHHSLVTMKNGEVYYHYYTWKKAKPLSKLRNIYITCVSWSNTVLERFKGGSSGPILLGTRSGRIYEVELEPSEEYFRREERYFQEVYQFGDSLGGPLSGLHWGRVPQLGKDTALVSKAFVIATTANCIYQFIGSVGVESRGESIFEKLFAGYKGSPDFQELPGEIDASQLCVFLSQGIPKSFAWMTAPGIYNGEINLASTNGQVIEKAHILPYPAQKATGALQEIIVVAPRYLACTQFHFILLYRDRVLVMSRLNDEIVFDATLPADLLTGAALAVDTAKGTYWLFSESSIYELLVVDEDRDVWSIYLEKKQFDYALEYSRTDADRDMIKIRQADNYFSQGRALLAASLYGQTSASFESCVLKFMGGDKGSPTSSRNQLSAKYSEALDKYLQEKFKRLPQKALTQRTLLATLLLDMRLIEYKAADSTFKLEDLLNWLKSQGVVASLDKRVAYQLFTSHGTPEIMVEYASLVQDYDEVLAYFVGRKDWMGALKALARHHSNETIYKYFPLLMRHAPSETVDLMIRYENLNVRELIRGILGSNHTSKSDKLIRKHAIRFLEHHVNTLKNQDTSIHNFLLSLYVLDERETQGTNLMLFIRSPNRHFDLQYALRLCNQWERFDACIVLYGELGLYEEAVDLALKQHDESLAEIYANRAVSHETLRKKLWLKISQYQIENSEDIRSAIKTLRTVDFITIEDVLAYLPNFVLVDDIKEEVSDILKEYK